MTADGRPLFCFCGREELPDFTGLEAGKILSSGLCPRQAISRGFGATSPGHGKHSRKHTACGKPQARVKRCGKSAPRCSVRSSGSVSPLRSKAKPAHGLPVRRASAAPSGPQQINGFRSPVREITESGV